MAKRESLRFICKLQRVKFVSIKEINSLELL
jgi:hypothetical protein